MKSFYAASLLFAAVTAQEDSAITQFNNDCIRCIDEGNQFCSINGSTGTCMEAECRDPTDDEKEAYEENPKLKTCNLTEESKKSCTDKNTSSNVYTSMIGYSQCNPASQAQCKVGGLKISKTEITDGGVEITDPTDANKLIQTPHSFKIEVPAKKSCKLEISLEDNAKDAKIGAFAATQWQNDLYVTFTKLEEGEAYDTKTSQLTYSNTWWWNRDHKDGDLAGRVPVKPKETYVLQIINNNDEDAQFLYLEYGSAISNVVTYTMLASTFAFAYLF